MRQPRKPLAEAPREAGRPLDSSNLDKLLGIRVHLLEQAMMRCFARHMDPLELTPTLYAILVLVSDNPACRQIDLSQALNMHQPNLVDRVNLLVARGLVTRREAPNDRRANVLELSFAGRHFMEKVALAHDAHEVEMQRMLGGDRYAALLQLMPPPGRGDD